MRDKERGFMEVKRKNPGYVDKEQRIKNYNQVEKNLSDEGIKQQAARCMDCGIPFCFGSGCTVANLIPEINDCVYHDKWEEAYHLLMAGCSFPEFTGQICPALCEGSCTLGLNDDSVSFRQIERAVIEKAYEMGYVRAKPPEFRLEEKIAVIGSGPAGLSIADALNKKGYNVTVFERAEKPGGLLQYGIPNFKLEKNVVERRIDIMKEEGIKFEANVNAGTDVSTKYLQERFDIIALAGGARQPRDLSVPGRELDGVHFALDFLTQQTQRVLGQKVTGEDILATGKKVVVIGGGDTGSDCIGTSNRQGAESVLQLEILPKPPEGRTGTNPWPQWPVQFKETSSHAEGCERRWCVTTKEIIGKDGKVTGLKCADIEWEKDENGRFNMKEIKEFDVEADLILLAMGFVGPGPNGIVANLEIELDPRGNIKRDDKHMTSADGVFVAGDMSRGASLVVHAIADGKAAADDIAEYLSK
ncbi:MAG: glutamate synthase subunit beta [Kiritimatiellae bacterium]|nr:glutamate synthase subunit beta [Kiritimatiellia bacterium]